MAHTARFLSTLSLRRATGDKFRQGRNEQFLSTLSLRRATNQHPPGTTRTTYFYPRSPCGERLLELIPLTDPAPISIHALLAESDRAKPLRKYHTADISIHALLAESDTHPIGVPVRVVISIHALLAESDVHCDTLSALAPEEFLSTLSLRRATRSP